MKPYPLYIIRGSKISLLLLALSSTLHAQTIERQVITAGGRSVTTPLQIDYTIGEPVVTTFSSVSIVLTQGFQQPSGIIPANTIFPYLLIFPNPTRGQAEARFILPSPAKMTISIYNVVGQLMSTEAINYTGGEMQYIIRSDKFIPGAYYIRFAVEGSTRTSATLLRLN